jgi:guanylate kinase
MQLTPGILKGFVLAVSAPSGTGKTLLCDRLRDEFSFVTRSISLTTRPKRDGEVSGRDYEFVSREDFLARQSRGEMLETAEVFGNLYGTPRKPVEDSLKNGKIIVMDIDTEGATNVKRLLSEDCVTVFILPPSLEELERRLKQRGKDSPEVLKKRLSEAGREISEAQNYEYVLANIDVEVAYRELLSIVLAERQRAYRLKLK